MSNQQTPSLTTLVGIGTFFLGVGVTALACWYYNRNAQAEPTAAEEQVKAPAPSKKPGEEQKQRSGKVRNPKNRGKDKLEIRPPDSGYYPAQPSADEFPLRLGSKGKRVERLQVYLLRKFGWTKVVDGVLDQQTLGQLKRFLKVDAVSQKLYHKLGLDLHVQDQ